MAILSSVSRNLDLASQLAIDARDARAIDGRVRAGEEARDAADQLAAQRAIEDEVTLQLADQRAALQEQLDAQRAGAADAAQLTTSSSYTRPPGLSLRYDAVNPAAAPGEPPAATTASAPAFDAPPASRAQFSELAAVAAYQLQVASGTDASSSLLRTRA